MPTPFPTPPGLFDRLEDLRPVATNHVDEVVPGLYRVRTRGAYAFLAIDDRVTLIDTGGPGSERAILSALEMLGRTPNDVETIVLTHGHIDHVGGLPALQALVPARTAIHLADARDVEREEALPNPFVNPLLARLMRPYLEFVDPGAARIDQYLLDGDELPACGGLRIVHSPGHTPGSISLHFPELGALVVGDAMQFRAGRLMPPNRMFTADMDEAIGSIRRLARLDFETMCFGHFRPIVRGAGRKVRAYARGLIG